MWLCIILVEAKGATVKATCLATGINIGYVQYSVMVVLDPVHAIVGLERTPVAIIIWSGHFPTARVLDLTVLCYDFTVGLLFLAAC